MDKFGLRMDSTLKYIYYGFYARDITQMGNIVKFRATRIKKNAPLAGGAGAGGYFSFSKIS
jgi:hypothetical protein